METGSILSADVLDIIFDQRNKGYGAYDLRKNYRARLTKALLITGSLVILVCTTAIVLAAVKPSVGIVNAPDVYIQAIQLPDETPAVKIPPPVQIKTPDVRTIKDYVPRIVPDQMADKDPVPEQKDVDDAAIGPITKDGPDAGDIITPPVDARADIVNGPKKEDDDDSKTWRTVEIESQYPGGIAKWAAFISGHLVYPQDALDDGQQGTVIVQFVVDKEGAVSDVEAISGPESLRNAAVTVIKKSGKWLPAIQNGRKVKSYKKQPITFRLSSDQ